MANCRAIDRATPLLLQPSVEDWLIGRPARHPGRPRPDPHAKTSGKEDC